MDFRAALSHGGVILALLVAVLFWWLIYKSIFGFELRTVGQNIKAARYAGIAQPHHEYSGYGHRCRLGRTGRRYQTLGLNHKFAPEFSGAVGFDGIGCGAVGVTHPPGVVLVALRSALDGGAGPHAVAPGAAADIIQVIQALVLAFVAAHDHPLVVPLPLAVRSGKPGHVDHGVGWN
ncbi:MAG: hypothetical protein R2911_17815 [Caldilineaceae bacterium]